MENCRRLPPALPSSPVCRLVAAFVLLMLQAIATAMAHTVVVDSADAFNRAVAAAKPGDVIDIANGRYDSWKIEVPKTVSGSPRRSKARNRRHNPAREPYSNSDSMLMWRMG